MNTYIEPHLNEDINPSIALTTHEGDILTTEESLFIHYIVAGCSNIEAFQKAGFKYPRRPIGRRKKEDGITFNDKNAILANDVKIVPEEELQQADTETATEKENTKPGGAKEKEEDILSQYSLINKPLINTTLLTTRPMTELQYRQACLSSASQLRKCPHVNKEIIWRLKMVQDAQVADEHEIYAYFTAVMRGQVKDQFGLEASLQERTRAAECLAKRIIDLPKRLEATIDEERLQGVKLVIQPRTDDAIDAEFREADS